VLIAQELVEENRIQEAADVYRSELEQSPRWALGHYNLALVQERLGRYGEAITSMRRFLYLEPSGLPAAADARAAQDQIYRWEAMLPR
jgi:tetratricopeptide (TPR) repeat protein